MTGRKKRVLAIDDNCDNLVSLKALINDAFPDADVITAFSGLQGIELAIAQEPDVILLDIFMPDMDGFELCRILKVDKRTSEIPVVLVTAVKEDTQNRIRGLECGAEGFLSKPIDESELITQIRAMLKIRTANIEKQDEKKRLAALIKEKTRELEKAQKETLNYCKDLLESQRIAHLGTWRLNLATNQVVWSDELYRMYGFDSTLPPPPYTEHMKLFTPESWDRLSTSLEYTRTSGTPYELELKTVTKNGSNGWMWVRGEAERDSKGNIIAIWGAAQDITERKKIEHELRQSEERFQLLFDKAPLGYQSLNVEGRFIEVNQKWLDALGYSKEEVIGEWFGDFLCPEYVEGFRKRFPIFKSQGYIHSEFEMRRKDGLRLFMAFEGKIGYGEDGTFKQTHCILQDITEQKKAEKALAESQESYRYLFEYSGAGIGYYTPEGVVISFNTKALRNMGGQIEDFVGKPIHSIFPKAEADKYLARIKKAVTSSQPQEYEDYLLLNESPKWFSSTFSKVMNIEKEIIGVQIISMDITDRKHAEESLAESQALLQAAFENSQAGIAIADAPDGKLRYVNKAGLLIRGQTEENLVRNIDIHNYVSSWNILHLDNTPYMPEEVPLARAVLHGETCSEEFIIRRDNHEDRIVLANAAPIKDSNNNIKAGIVVFLDSTDRKKAEESLRRSEERFKLIFEQAPTGIAVVDSMTANIITANQSFADITGRTIEELSTIDWISITHPDDVQVDLDNMALMNAGKIDGFNMVKRYLRPNNSILWINMKITPIKDNNEHLLHLCMIEDITESKKTENNLLYISNHDYLTELYNRRHFEEALSQFNTEENLPLSIIMCDVNGLKLINDSFGHTIGDDYLKKTAEIIKKACREDDIIARLGGDEFAVILRKADSVETQQILDRIKGLASNTKIANVELSISVGYDTKVKVEQSIVDVLANAENVMYKHKLNERSSMRSKTIDLIMKTLFEKSSREMLHSQRVSAISEEIAKKMNYDKDEIGQIRIAGLVHDIGKIGIDEKILNKNGKPDDKEWQEIKKHPEMGWRILSSTNEFSELANIVIAHHEKWDGSGYPNGLKGEKIPLEARIIAVADAFDAMTSQRSYRIGVTHEAAIHELKRCSGTQFDPEIVQVFVEKVIPYNSFS